MKTKTPWEQMTKAQKASAHLREARYFARKALRMSRAENVKSMESCLYYARQWGATDGRCNKVRAMVK